MAAMLEPDPFTRAAQAAAVMMERLGPDHDVAVVAGSGWGGTLRALGLVHAEMLFTDLPHQAAPTVSGHEGRLLSLTVGTSRVLVLAGRAHLYEGRGPSDVVHAVRAAVLAGCKTVVLTNASGGINPTYEVGQPVLIADHVNLTALSPLTGAAPPEGYRSRFVDLTTLYPQRLRDLARRADSTLVDGVYAGLVGPHFETPAEIRALRVLGADLVGMSTVLESIAAHHLGAGVLGIALVSNPAAGVTASALHHADIVAATQAAGERLGLLLEGVLAELSRGQSGG